MFPLTLFHPEYFMNDQASEKYDIAAAAAWIIGHSLRTGEPDLPVDLIGRNAFQCSAEEQLAAVKAGLDAGLKLYPFKRGTGTLARVRRTFGFLRSVSFETMLDVGSGRGVFLLPFMEEFPEVRVTSVDLLEKRVTFLNELAAGGFTGLTAVIGDICQKPFPDNSFDVVTMLEVLEHIPDVEKAVRAAVKIAKKFVAVTVPSKPDSNPEHIHLLTKEKLTAMFTAAGASRLHFDAVEGHLFMTASVGDK